MSTSARTPRHRIVALGFAVALLSFTGCSSGNDDSRSVESIEPILAGDIDIVPDASGTSATFAVETTIPVACAVIYGTDDSFGSIAVDNDMQGGAHEDHAPLLTGLSPDTEYQYVLQGSDAAGSIYRSDTMSFRTPPVDEFGLGPNVATSGTVNASSSQFSDAFAAENAIDGDLGTEWSTDGDGDDAWIELDLDGDQEITGVAFRTRQMTDGTAVTESFTVAVDGVAFGPFPAGSEPALFDQPITGRRLRFDADQTTGGNTGATEIEVYGSD